MRLFGRATDKSPIGPKRKPAAAAAAKAAAECPPPGVEPMPEPGVGPAATNAGCVGLSLVISDPPLPNIPFELSLLQHPRGALSESRFNE